MFAELNNLITISYKKSDGSMLDDILRDDLLRLGIVLASAEGAETERNSPTLKITKKGLFLEEGGTTLFFHPSMALLRMVNVLKGEGDRFLEAVDLNEGDVFLDATMGLASDALMAAYIVGKQGTVIAVEKSPLIYILVKDGLARMMKQKAPSLDNPFKHQAWINLIEAASRVDPMCSDHHDYLSRLPDQSVDVIYFDPMFRFTAAKSASMKPVKQFSHPEPLRPETIQNAIRVAKKRVVLKERSGSLEFERLGFSLYSASKYSTVQFGVITLNGKGGHP